MLEKTQTWCSPEKIIMLNKTCMLQKLVVITELILRDNPKSHSNIPNFNDCWSLKICHHFTPLFCRAPEVLKGDIFSLI